MSKPTDAEIAEFLCELRDSGEVNMWGAAPYIHARFFGRGMTQGEARAALIRWIESFDQQTAKDAKP